MQGMQMEENGQYAEAKKTFMQAWDEATTDLEKFPAAYYVARHQQVQADKLSWLKLALHLALKINDTGTNSALPNLYTNIAAVMKQWAIKARLKHTMR